jgi:excisionase family DNA binding protein
MVRRSHLSYMTNHTIAAPISSWAELLTTDRGVLNRAEVAGLLDVDARTIDHAIEDRTIPAERLGRRILIPRRPFMRAFRGRRPVGLAERRSPPSTLHVAPGTLSRGR